MKKFVRLFVLFAIFVALALPATAALAAPDLPTRVGAGLFQQMEFELTPELLAGLVGGLITLVFTYFPNLRTWFAAKPSEVKSLAILAMLVLASFAIYAGQCWLGLWSGGLTCDRAGILALAIIFWEALKGNVITFIVAPKPIDLQMARDASKAEAHRVGGEPPVGLIAR